MKIIMVGMVAFVVCKYPSPEKNTKLEVKTNITKRILTGTSK
jgi:hypothetical protein